MANQKGTVVSLRAILAIALVMSIATIATAQIPSGYYNGTDGLSGQALADTVHEIIDDHTRYPYTSSSTDTWDILSDADEDPANASNILSIYKNASRPKSDHTSGSGWNREHSWPKSLGFPNDGGCNYPYTDTHHLFAADWAYNSARSNKPFDVCVSGCSEYPADNTSLSNYTSGSFTSGTWEPWDDVKGDLARAMFYMAVRYNGGTHGVTGCVEPDLRLTNDRALITSDSGSNRSVAYMGLLDTLLSWHNADPVDDFERARNEVVFSYQDNRNPFVDHPEWVSSIFGSGDGSGGTNGGGDPGGGDPGGGDPGGGDPGGGGTVVGEIWINEIHYDNSSTDSGEGIEIAGPAGTDLTGWQLVGYNGNGGASYTTVDLSGTLADDVNGIGFSWFAISGLQNGSPDGIALVNPSAEVTMFLSYEGTLAAIDGPANGLTSVDIGESEDGSTPVGFSLQLGGSGRTYADFNWQSAQASTEGAINNGQDIPEPGILWINEIHYDNSSTDTGEGIEVAGPAGTDLTGWQLVGYNGNGGAAYQTVDLGGSLTDSANGYGFAWFAFTGLQNGSPDGIALVDPSGTVVQFLSYEGTLIAVGGPADGMTSTDIGVSEDGSTPVGYSLQLAGEGTSYDAFTWETAASATIAALNNNQSFGGDPGGGDPGGGGEEPLVWINEIHYDNSSTDIGEGVEIAGPAGSDLTGWQLVGYNGNGGASYQTVDLDGTLADQQNGYGTAWFAFTGLQNGSPDGIALVDPSGNVAQFLSYEGSLTAIDGPAAGMTSTDIGVSEASSTEVGFSLQLGGTGTSYSDFTWEAPASATEGAVNNNQSFPAPAVDPWINEIHYDNSSTDVDEGVEIAGVAGLDLTGWQLIGYNGNGGASYDTVDLSGSIDDEGAGYGALWFAISGLQNGSPDGIALVDPDGNVVQFLSYEGSLTAIDGPASGLTSDDIGVSESSSSAIGDSLQLEGIGTSYADFSWRAPSAHSRGDLNAGQVLGTFLDSDADGVADEDDDCPASNVTATVVINGCDTGVANVVSATGCTISDAIAEEASDVPPRWLFTSRVSGLLTLLVDAGSISDAERTAIMGCVSQYGLPTANDDSYSTNADDDLIVAAPGVLANDTDVEGDALEAHLYSGPSMGQLSLQRDGSFTYRAYPGSSGVDSFVYKAWDGSGFRTATVTITVSAGNSAPVTADDAYTVSAGTRLTVGAPGVLANDTDADGDALTAYLVTQPAVGHLGFHNDGSFWFDAPAGYNGTVSFTYKAGDGMIKTEATVTLTIN